MLKLLAFGVKFQMKSKWGKEECGRADVLKRAKARELNPVSEF